MRHYSNHLTTNHRHNGIPTSPLHIYAIRRSNAQFLSDSESRKRFAGVGNGASKDSTGLGAGDTGAIPLPALVSDVVAWSQYADLQHARKGAAVELVFFWGGIARDFVRGMPIAQKTQGGIIDLGDGSGPRHWDGFTIIMVALFRHVGHLAEEEATGYLMELYTFRQRSFESMDAYLTRSTILHHRSVNINGIALNPSQQSRMVMTGMGVDQRAQ